MRHSTVEESSDVPGSQSLPGSTKGPPVSSMKDDYPQKSHGQDKKWHAQRYIPEINRPEARIARAYASMAEKAIQQFDCDWDWASKPAVSGSLAGAHQSSVQIGSPALREHDDTIGADNLYQNDKFNTTEDSGYERPPTSRARREHDDMTGAGNYPFDNQNDRGYPPPRRRKMSSGVLSKFLEFVSQFGYPNEPSQPFDLNQFAPISPSTTVKDQHNGSGSKDCAADLPTAQTSILDVVTSKQPANYLSLVSEDPLGPIDRETPTDIPERPTRNPENFARTDDPWNRRESTEYDTQADSSDSSDTSEEDELPETHPFRLHVRTICNAGLAEFLGLVTTAGDSDTRNTQSGPSFTSRGEGPGTQGRSGNSRKCALSRVANNREDQDDEPNGKKPKLQQPNEDDGPTLACPFYKLSPAKHSNCLHFRLKRIKDVKQHLQRKHKQPHYCPICGVQFETQALLQAHTRARSCEDVIFTVPEGVSEDQRTRLGDRVSRTQTVTNQWYTIWDILFQETPRPASPLVESPIHEVLSSFREFWYERGQELISEHLQRTAEISYSQPREERDLNAFHTLLLHESMEELINRFMNRFADPSTSSPIRGVPTPASNQVTGLHSDDNLDLPIRLDSDNVHGFVTPRELAVPHLVNDSGSDPSTQSTRVASALQTNTIALVDADATHQVLGSQPEELGSLSDSRWMDEWIERQESNGATEDPIGNDILLYSDFDVFLQGGNSKASDFEVPADFTSG